eukprot:1467989-Amphidinium_carterae.1
MIFILGNCNFPPDDFPIDLLQGGEVNRPLSTVTYTSPQGELEFDLDFVSQGYMGQSSYETAERTDPLVIAVEYQNWSKSSKTNILPDGAPRSWHTMLIFSGNYGVMLPRLR